MSFFNLKKIKSLTKLNKIYRLLSKTYHPDNKVTGNVEQFIELKEEYDNAKKIVSSLPTSIVINITTTQAFKGKEVVYNSKNGETAIIKIPPKFYKQDNVLIKDNNGNKYIVSVNIKPDEDENITYSRNGDIIITKYIDVTPLDLLTENIKTFKLFGEEKKIQITKNLINNIQQPFMLLNIGYPLKKDRKKRGNVKIKFRIKSITLDDNDKKDIVRMKEKYKCQLN